MHQPHRTAPRRTPTPLRVRLTCIAAIALLAAAGAAVAAEDSMARIARTGRIVLGAHDAAVPISYLAPTGEHIGYQLDICERVVAAIRQRLNLAQLRTTTVPMLMSTRTALLNNGTIDIDCGPNPINNATLRQSLLSHATLAYELTLMTTAEKGGLTLAGLNGKAIGEIVGSPAVPRMRAIARDSRFMVSEVFVREGNDVLEMLSGGRIDAFSAPLPYLLAMRAAAPDVERYVVLDIPLGKLYAAIGFRLADEDLRAVANDVIVALARSGELARLYDKWFVRAIPGVRHPVGAPLTQAQRDIIATPGSEMLGM